MTADLKRDAYFSIQTVGIQDWDASSAHYNRYEATPYEALDILFQFFDMPSTGRFIDFGSGKGRVPIYIHHYFRNPVCGIERSFPLLEKAQENEENYRLHHNVRGNKIDWVCMQAERYVVQPTDTMFYFFNPFSVQIFAQVVANILHSVHEHPRPIYIILFYETVEYRDWIERYTTLSPIQEIELSVKDPYEKFVIYTN